MEERSTFWGLIILGATMGIVHLFWAASSMFVFKVEEPLTSWIALIAGPLLTLSAFIISIFKHEIGGTLLIAGGITSLIAAIMGYWLNVVLIYYVLLVNIPMLILGRGFLTLQD